MPCRLRWNSVLLLAFPVALAGAEAARAQEGAVDLVFVATTPPLFNKERVFEYLKEGLNAVSNYRLANDSVEVDPLSEAEYRDIKRLAENAVETVDSVIDSAPRLFPLEAAGTWIVRAPNPKVDYAGIGVQYQVRGESEQQTGEWKIDAADAEGPDVRFRLHSRVNGEYEFRPDPSWTLLNYQLLPDGDWAPWPQHRRMFLVRVKNFPADPVSYGNFKRPLAERKVNPLRIQGEREALFSIATVGEATGVDSLKGGWSQEAYNIDIHVPEVDEVWVLFPLTLTQKNAVTEELVKLTQEGETEAGFAGKLKAGGAATLAGHRVAASTSESLSGREGVQWHQLSRQTDGTFHKSFTVSHAPLWARIFASEGGAQPSAAYYVVVGVSGGRAVTVGEAGEFWAVRQSATWNGGQNPQQETPATGNNPSN